MSKLDDVSRSTKKAFWGVVMAIFLLIVIPTEIALGHLTLDAFNLENVMTIVVIAIIGTGIMMIGIYCDRLSRPNDPRIPSSERAAY